MTIRYTLEELDKVLEEITKNSSRNMWSTIYHLSWDVDLPERKVRKICKVLLGEWKIYSDFLTSEDDWLLRWRWYLLVY